MFIRLNRQVRFLICGMACLSFLSLTNCSHFSRKCGCKPAAECAEKCKDKEGCKGKEGCEHKAQ